MRGGRDFKHPMLQVSEDDFTTMSRNWKRKIEERRDRKNKMEETAEKRKTKADGKWNIKEQTQTNVETRKRKRYPHL